MANRRFFTLVFEGDIRKSDANPLTTQTPFGVAFISSEGNAVAEREAYRAIVQRVAEHFSDTDSPLGEAARAALEATY